MSLEYNSKTAKNFIYIGTCLIILHSASATYAGGHNGPLCCQPAPLFVFIFIRLFIVRDMNQLFDRPQMDYNANINHVAIANDGDVGRIRYVILKRRKCQLNQ